MSRREPTVRSALLRGGGRGHHVRASQPRSGPGVVGSVSLEGITVLLGPNSAGKSTVLEMLEPAFQRRGPALYSNRRSYIGEEIWIEIRDPWLDDTLARLAARHSLTDAELDCFRAGPVDGGYWLGTRGGEDCSLSVEPDEGEAFIDIGGLHGVASTLGLPIAVSAPTEDADPDTILTIALNSLLHESREGWLVAERDDAIALNPRVMDLAHRLEQQLRGQVPAFLEADGPLRLVVLPLLDWHRPDASPARVHLCVQTPIGLLRAADSGRGMRRWAVVASRMAAARVQAQLAAEEDLMEVGGQGFTAPQQFLILIDEPEAHLHQIAQVDVCRWLVDQVHRDSIVVLATHSPQMLQLPSELVRYHRVTRADWRDQNVATDTAWLPPYPEASFSTISDITAEIATSLRDEPAALGYEGAVWLSAIRALVFVEGRHDLLLLEHFYGRELQRLRLRPYALHGGKRSRAIAESDLVTSLGVRLLFVFDNVRAEALAEDQRPIDALSDEEKLTRNLLSLRDQGRDISVVPYEDPDVVCAVRPSALQRIFRHTASKLGPLVEDDGWEPAVSAFRRSGRSNFKHWLLVEQLACGTSAERALEKLIGRLRPSDSPTTAFARMWNALTAAAVPRWDHGVERSGVADE